MNDEIEVQEEAKKPFVLVDPTPLQLQLIESAREMGLDVEWYKEHILTDPICLNGLQLVEDWACQLT